MRDEENHEYKNLYQILVKEGTVRLISLTKYKNWRSVVDEIVECEYILSSSLHGLIISDAYRVPNLWIEFSHPVGGNRFKYHDYFSSVNRTEKEPLVVHTSCDLNIIYEMFEEYKPIKIDLRPLLESSPFKIKDKEQIVKCCWENYIDK